MSVHQDSVTGPELVASLALGESEAALGAEAGGGWAAGWAVGWAAGWAVGWAAGAAAGWAAGSCVILQSAYVLLLSRYVCAC